MVKIYTNKQLINAIIQDIEDRPSVLIEDSIKEQNFVKLFKGKENHEMKGIVLEYPQTANIFASILYDRVISLGVVEGLTSVNEFEIFRKEDLKNAGAWYRMATDIKDVKDFDKNASPIPQSESRKGVVYSSPMQRKLIEFTFSNEQLSTAFESDEGLNELLMSEMKSVRDTINIYINDMVRNVLLEIDEETLELLNVKEFSFENQDKFLLVQYFTGEDYNELFNDYVKNVYPNSDETVTSKAVPKETLVKNLKDLLKTSIVNDAISLSKPTRKYNIGDSDGGYMRNIPLGNGVLILNQYLHSLIDTEELKKYFKEIILMDTTINAQEEIINYMILDDNILEYRVSMDKTLNWTNPKGLYTNYFTHLWLSYLVNPFVNGIARRMAIV